MSNSRNPKHDISSEVSDKETQIKAKKLQESFISGKISRRNFVSTSVAIGVSLAGATAVVNQVEAATPKSGGRLRMGITGGATSDILDPGQILDAYMINVSMGQVRPNMTKINPDGSVEGDLSSGWQASNGAKTWKFDVRQGVEFHNGKTLDSTDIVDSIRHHMGPDTKSGGSGVVSGIVSIKEDGKYGVVVELNEGNGDLPILLSDYHLNICPSKGDGSIDWESGIGAGPYTLEEHEPGVRTLTKKFANYWNSGNDSHFDEVETLGINDPTARLAALSTGAVDAINNVPAKTASRLKSMVNVKTLISTGNKQCTMPMLCDVAPFDDQNVRNAIKHIINRQELLDKIFFGYGQLGNDNPIGPANYFRANTDELPQREYDPEQAKYFLKQAGLSSLSVKFHAADTGFTGAVDAGALMRESAKAAGIDIEVVREPNDGYWSNVWMVKPWSACYWSGRPTEDWIFSQIYYSKADWNDTHWNNSSFDKLLVEARSETDEAKRRDKYVEMQRIVHNDGGLALPVFLSEIMGYRTNISVPDQIANNWELDGHLAARRWWTA
ncbi:MAG: ABC transporter substrate-binding protein [Proteobacteria bacterium]|nr:ABC transporter substrate-binding protein [Pseudomonadota bacterium]